MENVYSGVGVYIAARSVGDRVSFVPHCLFQVAGFQMTDTLPVGRVFVGSSGEGVHYVCVPADWQRQMCTLPHLSCAVAVLCSPCSCSGV